MGEISKKIIIKFVFCPTCGQGQHATSGINQELGEILCEACGAKFNPE